jgi:hypothetical protein
VQTHARGTVIVVSGSTWCMLRLIIHLNLSLGHRLSVLCFIPFVIVSSCGLYVSFGWGLLGTKLVGRMRRIYILARECALARGILGDGLPLRFISKSGGFVLLVIGTVVVMKRRSWSLVVASLTS